uniref:Uncharacterized protein n=1 Tax=Chelydra serpentina TaxID=8475 RepID=A0A8C3RZE6_CHESE
LSHAPRPHSGALVSLLLCNHPGAGGLGRADTQTHARAPVRAASTTFGEGTCCGPGRVRAPLVPYAHLHGNKTLFHNSHANPLPTGYEENH